MDKNNIDHIKIKLIKNEDKTTTRVRWFHLHLLVFPFVYQFNSRIGGLDRSSFAND